MQPKISIIVPIYNVEKYLARCLDSLLAQDLKEIEIIAVNDGSTDNSLDILKNYSVKDGRIKIIDKQNAGVSSARNEGILAANGEYLGFVDPDDWVDLNMYDVMYNIAKRESIDVIMCSYIREFGNHSKVKDFLMPAEVRYEKEEVKKNVLRRLVGPINEEIGNPELLDAWGTVWSKIYRTTLIKDNGIKFTDLQKIGTSEDTLFNIKVLFHVNSFVFLNKPLYHYWRVNDTSITSGYKPNLMDQWFHLYNEIASLIKQGNLNKEFFDALNNRICLNMLGLGLNTICEDNKLSAGQKIKKLQHILNDQRIKSSFSQLELSHFPVVWKIFYFCAKSRFAVGFFCLLVSIELLRKSLK